jgi:hypothetical protein
MIQGLFGTNFPKNVAARQETVCVRLLEQAPASMRYDVGNGSAFIVLLKVAIYPNISLAQGFAVFRNRTVTIC